VAGRGERPDHRGVDRPVVCAGWLEFVDAASGEPLLIDAGGPFLQVVQLINHAAVSPQGFADVAGAVARREPMGDGHSHDLARTIDDDIASLRRFLANSHVRGARRR
jgi:hypothetical protein